MYKSFSGKRFGIAINKFPKTAKRVSRVYLTGFRAWDSFESKNYSIVIGTFRLILYINKPNACETRA